MRKFIVFSLLALTPAIYAQSPEGSQPVKKEQTKKKGKGAVSEVAGGVGSAAGRG